MAQQNQSFFFIPSGVTPNKFANLKGVWLNKATSANLVSVRDDGSVEIQTHGKTLLITQTRGPVREGALDLNPFNPGNYFEGMMPRALATFADLNEGLGMPCQGPTFTTVDSGEFQAMARGITIILEHYGRFININGNEAFVSDPIPTGLDFFFPDRMHKLAKEQQRRTQLLKEMIARSDLTMINIMHGQTWKQQKAWLELVWDDDLTHLAIGSDAKSLIENLPLIGHLIFELNIERLHFLGINGELKIPLIALIGQYVDVTIDGSQAVEHSFERRMIWSLLPEGKLEETAVGTPKTAMTQRSLGGQSSCNCKACQLAPHLEAYAIDSTITLPLLFMHNQFVQQQFVKRWSDWVVQSTDQALEQYLRVFGGKPTRPNFRKRKKLKKEYQIIRYYMQLANEKGVDAANRFLATVR